MEYTEGEWKVVKYSIKERPVYCVETAEHQICGLEPGHAASDGLPKEEHEANAYLIASAPDCHRELSGIVTAFEQLGWSAFMSEMGRRLPSAKQALAKADDK